MCTFHVRFQIGDREKRSNNNNNNNHNNNSSSSSNSSCSSSSSSDGGGGGGREGEGRGRGGGGGGGGNRSRDTHDLTPTTTFNTTTTTVNTTVNTTVKPPLLVSFGNPLLDLTAVVKDATLHRCFGLPVDGQLEVNSSQRPVFSHVMKEYPVEYTAGGCALNSSRVFCWVLGEGQRVVFVGGIGEDQAATRLSKIVEESGVITRFVKVPGQPTGVCVALVLGACRCLCADIGAAATCLPQHVFTPDLLPTLEAAEFIYVEGYFITHSFPAALQIAEYAQRNHKTLVFNLCGSYVCENNSEELRQLLPFVDILFGFVEEYRTLDSALDVEELSAKECRDPESICHDLLLVLKAIRGEANVIEDCVKEKKEGKEVAEKINTSSDACVPSSTFSSSSSSDTVNTTAPPHHHHNYHNDTTSLCDGDENDALVDGAETSPVNQSPTHSPSQSVSQGVSQSSSQSTGDLPNGTLPHMSNGNHFNSHTPTKSTTNDTHTHAHRVKQRVVVVTKGPSPLLYCHRGRVRERPVPPITPEEIVDTTGAGDSFVGGFLAALSQKRELAECLDCGVWTAQHLLRQKGCTLPPYPAEFLA
ncbi:uncharacterized protein LOC127010163 isoform X2 [Eriocheir sinensis]|uniref:uncharacterized protein LOC127010163 isoform X2 n=1 Tax=Eriocheir sinensis TaxID=95602 RepID=UPI0021CA2229|nr:uncharacterized protein LOC127010163 isoform X2 [Eriocheir sinensis]